MYEQYNRELTVHLPKELDHHTADGIRQEIDRRIVQNGLSVVTFDFGKTTFMDSSGIGLLIGRYKMVNYVGGCVRAVEVSEKIEKLLRFANVQKFVKIIRARSV